MGGECETLCKIMYFISYNNKKYNYQKYSYILHNSFSFKES